MSERSIFNNGAWTKSRFNSFVKSALRSASMRWPPKYSCLKAAATEKRVNQKTGRLAQHFQCNSCKLEFPQKEVSVDHIIPLINPVVGFTTWDELINNMFCEVENLQVLCKDCHQIKTTKEKQLKKEQNDKRKK